MGNLGLMKSICRLTDGGNGVSRELLVLKDVIMHKRFSYKAPVE